MKNKIILFILHVINVSAFLFITAYSIYIKDTALACFCIIVVLCWLGCALCWLGCTIFDILDLCKLTMKNKETSKND